MIRRKALPDTPVVLGINSPKALQFDRMIILELTGRQDPRSILDSMQSPKVVQTILILVGTQYSRARLLAVSIPFTEGSTPSPSFPMMKGMVLV